MRPGTRTEIREITLSAVLRRDEDGKVIAVCQELPVDAFGDTVEEAAQRLREAIDFYFETASELDGFDELLSSLEQTPAPQIDKPDIDVFYQRFRQSVSTCAGY